MNPHLIKLESRVCPSRRRRRCNSTAHANSVGRIDRLCAAAATAALAAMNHDQMGGAA